MNHMCWGHECRSICKNLITHARRVFGAVFLGSICLERWHSSWKSLWRDVTESCIAENEALTDSVLSSRILFWATNIGIISYIFFYEIIFREFFIYFLVDVADIKNY